MCGRPLNLHILLLHTDADYNKFSMSSSYSCILQYYANNFLQLYCIRLQGEQLEFCKPFNNARVDVFCIIFIWLFGESIRENEWKWEESRQSHVHVEDGKINWKYVRLWFVFRPHFSIHSPTHSISLNLHISTYISTCKCMQFISISEFVLFKSNLSIWFAFNNHIHSFSGEIHWIRK